MQRKESLYPVSVDDSIPSSGINSETTVQSALDRAQIELHDMAAQIRLLEDLGESNLCPLSILTFHGTISVEFQREKEAQSLEDHRNLQQRYEQVEAQNTQAERELALERAKGKQCFVGLRQYSSSRPKFAATVKRLRIVRVPVQAS